MTGVNNSSSWAKSDAIAEVVSAESCRIVMETPPPEYLEKISRYLESTVGQSGQDKVSNEPTEADSDSGDSLFITQKPVPAPVRSIRSRCNQRSDPTCVTHLEESEDDNSSAASNEEPKNDREGRRKTYKLPEYGFPFLKEKRCKARSRGTQMLQNISLCNSAMGGFFECVREMWQGYQRGDDVAASLPTVDIDGAYISPLSEEEEEREGNEDITVVERKLFAVPLKTKSQRNWCNLSKQKKRRKATDAGHDTSQEKQRERSHEIPAKATTSRIRPESSDDGETIQAVKKKQNELETRGENFLNKPERLKTERLLHEEKKMQKGREEELCNQQKEKEVSRTLTEPQTDDLSQTAQTKKLNSLPDITSDTNTDSVCNETKVKKRKKKKDKRQGQSQEEPEGAASLNVEGDEIPSLSEENRAGPLTSQTSDELELNQRDLTEKSSNYENILRQEERDTPDSKHKKKKKRKKNKSAAENVTQEVDGNLESDVREEDSTFLSCNAEKKKKKKRKRKADEEDVDVEQLQSRAVVEHDAKKEKRKKQCKIDEIINAEDKGNSSEASEGTIESSFLKRKKQKKKRQTNDATQDGEQDADESFFNNAVALAESTETALQKTKKKTISEGMVNSYDPEEKAEESRQDRNAQVVTKKKKKKKKRESEIGSRNISENSVAQSDDSVSVQEKEKKRTSSFLVADAESSQSVEAHVQVLESVCDGDLVTESAEFAGNLEEGNDGVRKKKKKKSKRKMSVSQDGVEKGHEQDFGEPKSTAESTDTEMRRKRKQTGSESEFVTPEERLENATDAGLSQRKEAVLPKKKKRGAEEPSHEIQESPPATTEDTESERSTLNTCNSLSHKEKHTSPPLETHGNQIFNDIRGKKKKKKVKSTDSIQPEGISSTNSTDLDPQNNEEEGTEQSAVPSILPSSPMSSETSLSKSEMSSSDRTMKTKHKKVKRRLHNPNEHFLMDP